MFSPNEARNQEGLDSVEYGGEPRVQAQVVPLSAAGAIPSAPAATPAPTLPDEIKRRDLDALTERFKVKRLEAAEPRKPVIRRTRVNS